MNLFNPYEGESNEIPPYPLRIYELIEKRTSVSGKEYYYYLEKGDVY